MEKLVSTVIVVCFLLASGDFRSVRAQAGPPSPAAAQTSAVSEDARLQAFLDEMAIKSLQGRPAIVIAGIVAITGVPVKLTTTSVRETVELVLRRNGIPVVQSCEGGTANCGVLDAIIRANCVDGLLPPPDTGLCAVYVKVAYRETVSSSRPQIVPAGVSGEIWNEDGLKLTLVNFREAALKQLTVNVEKFALDYLRANPK